MTESTSRDPSALVHAIYEAAETSEPLVGLASRMVCAFDSNRLHFMLLDGAKTPMVQGWDAIDLMRNAEEDIREYMEQWNPIDPRFHLSLQRRGEVHSDVEVLAPDVFERSAFNNEFLRGIGQRYSMFTTTEVTGGHLLGFAFMRPKKSGHYRTAERELATELVPHLGRALRMRALLDEAHQRSSALEATLDRLPVQVALVNADAKIVFANSGARALLAAADGVTSRDGRLDAVRPTDSSLLRSAIEEVATYVRRGVAGGAGPSRSVRVMRSDASFGVLSLFPVGTKSPLRARVPRARVLCVLYDSAERPVLDPEQLRMVFDLTPAETELANALVQGKSLAEFAAQRGTKPETVRTQMKRLLGKTETRSQADFVRHVSLMLALRMSS